MVKGLAKSEPLCFTVLPRTRESCSASTTRSLLFQQLALTPVGACLLFCTWKLSNSSFLNVSCFAGSATTGGGMSVLLSQLAKQVTGGIN